LTSALVIAAVTGVFVGRLIDRGHGRMLMTTSALVGAGLIALLPVIDHLWQFYLIWSLVGIMMAGCLYEPCFAVVTRQFGSAAKQPIILITLVAGFAGTLCFPLATSIADAWGWRTSVWVFSLLVGGVAAPLFWLGVGPGASESAVRRPPVSVGFMEAARPVLSRPIFWLLAIAFGALSLNHGMIISHALPLMESRGVSPGVAVLAASLFGVAQVIGRLCLLGFNPRTSLVSVCGWAFAALCLASVSLAAASAALIFLFLFVGLQGGGVGIQTIAKPVVTAEVLGRTHFGTISALVSFAYILGWAFAPSVAGIVWALSGYTAVLKVTFGLGLLGLLCVCLTIYGSRRQS
jgi:MFS family permease